MTYKLKYRFSAEAGAFTKDEIGPDGGCDALILGSIISPEDGGFSAAWLGVDGRSGEVTPLDALEMFKAWALLSAELMDADELPANLRAIARKAHEATRAHVLGLSG